MASGFDGSLTRMGVGTVLHPAVLLTLADLVRVSVAPQNAHFDMTQSLIGTETLTTARSTFATTLAERPSTRKPRSSECLAKTVMFALPT
jgi:hypothetical protein